MNDETKTCHICGRETDDGFECADCQQYTCQLCGDGVICNECSIDDIMFGML